jgi:hypothetical protein
MEFHETEEVEAPTFCPSVMVLHSTVLFSYPVSELHIYTAPQGSHLASFLLHAYFKAICS